MKSKSSFGGVLILLGVLVFQLVLIQVVLFLVSYLLVLFGGYGQGGNFLDAVILGTTFSAGSFLAGWIALKFHWLDAEPKYPARAIAALLGAFIPLLAGVLLQPPLNPGSPFYAIAILLSILGFHVPSWIKSQ